jgi:hypothetical protein
MGFYSKLKRGPLFYWRLRRHNTSKGRSCFWMTPWFTLWFLWDAPWSPSENGRFLFRGLVLEYREHDKDRYITAEVERPWLIRGEVF